MVIDVLILYEHIDRELESALFLERRLREKGYVAKIAHVGWDEAVARVQYQPKMIVTPWCYDDRDLREICNFKSGQVSGKLKVLNIHCEQISNIDTMQFLMPSGKAKDIYHLAWGEFFKDCLLSAGVKDENVCISGSSRLDFFKKECSRINKDKTELAVEFKLNNQKKWILFVGNFSAAFFNERRIDDLEKRNFTKVRNQVNLSRKTYEKVLTWYDLVVERCSHESLGVEFIYRPHPSELLTGAILELEKKYPNFHIIRNYSIRDWFVNCDAAFSWNSTSAIEAAFAEIPIYALRPIQIPDDLTFPILESLQQIVTVEQFIDIINSCLKEKNSHVNDLFRSEIDYYYSTQNKLATDLTVEYIEKILQDDGSADAASTYTNFLSIRKLANFLLKLCLLKAGVMPKTEKYMILKNEYISKERYEMYKMKIQRI